MAFEAVSHELFSTQRAEMTALDVVRLRDALTNEGPVTFAEALALTAVEGALTMKAAGWRALYIDAMVAHFVTDTVPEGYLDARKAERLLALAAPGGRFSTTGTFEMLRAVITAARWVPERLPMAALDEILCAVAYGDGALRRDTTLSPGTIGAADVERVRHILYVAQGPVGRSSAFTTREVLALLAIDAMAQAASQTWTDLFVAALTDAALTASGLIGPSREAVLSPQRPAARTMIARYRTASIEERSLQRLERQRIEIITGDDPAPVDAAGLASALHAQPETAGMVQLGAVLKDALALLDPELQGVLATRPMSAGFGAPVLPLRPSANRAA